ncbi:MAG: MazG nucleotide pyrophosphohydrolase [Parcubacteria group bacterium GW2011_GWA2_43_11]|nr:MAG: MazG nucleotide pyrophosphohydrolase [Parcubacteria group bacterium GW2011_GWA2_43_11]
MDNQKTLQQGTIKELQDYVEFKIKERGFENETLHERLVLLMEEVGELAKTCRKVSGMNIDVGREDAYKVGEEITDVLNMLFGVGIVLGIDIEKEYFNKESKINQRTYERSKKKLEK